MANGRDTSRDLRRRPVRYIPDPLAEQRDDDYKVINYGIVKYIEEPYDNPYDEIYKN